MTERLTEPETQVEGVGSVLFCAAQPHYGYLVQTLEEDLHLQCLKRIRRWERYARELREEDVRRARRDGHEHEHRALLMRPASWDADPAFNPYLVRDRIGKIATAVRVALKRHEYEPFASIQQNIPKSDGTSRIVQIFSIADTAVATRTLRSLNDKNSALMSAFSFAYRSDRSPHDAVHLMSNEFHKPGRLFVAEYDFSKFFDTINHDALWATVDERGVLLTPLERHVVSKFLTSRSTQLADYDRKAGSPRTSGIPQGNSISLFAANMSALNMDRAIERTGVGYARYADDTVMWAAEYDRLISGVEALRKEGARIGARINVAKSPGVRIFAQPNEAVEFCASPTVDYIGYSFSRTQTSMRNGTTARIKSRCNDLIWRNLLSNLYPYDLDPRRFAGNIDRDYVVLIFQLRRYIYGGMSEQKLRRILEGKALRVHYPGVMSYFPLVDDLKQLQALDGWLVNTIEMALKKRIRAIEDKGFTYPAAPTTTRKQLLTLETESTSGAKLDLRIPSFARIGTAILNAARTHGASAVSKAAKGNDYLYEFV